MRSHLIMHRCLSMALLVAPAALLALPACDGASMPDEGVTDATPGSSPDTQLGLPAFRSCLSGTLPQGLPTVSWSNLSNRIITLATPWHSAQDALVAEGQDTVIPGKFSYGSVSKDLEGERIEIWIDDCRGGYRRLGERVTDSDGRIRFPMTAAEVPALGEYGLYLRVMGDSSAAHSVLRVYPPNTQFIVFDIDATLTTSDSALVGQVVSEILDGSLVPEPRPGALDNTWLRHSDHGYELLYVTGRPYLLTSITRDWLRDLGFPPGTLRVTDSVGSSWPSDSEVGSYKAAYLGWVKDQDMDIPVAYGNATTDIYAYAQAAIPKDRTYILGDNGGKESTVALGDGYLQHNTAIAGEAPVVQPFTR